MTLLEAVKAKQEETKQAKRCVLGKILADTDGETHQALVLAIQNVKDDLALPLGRRQWSIQWLFDTLNNTGYPIGKTVVGEHIHGKCACAKS